MFPKRIFNTIKTRDLFQNDQVSFATGLANLIFHNEILLKSVYWFPIKIFIEI